LLNSKQYCVSTINLCLQITTAPDWPQLNDSHLPTPQQRP